MPDQPLPWWYVRWGLAARTLWRVAVPAGKVLCILGCIAGAAWFCFWLLSPWLEAKSMASSAPLTQTPAALPNRGTAALSNISIEAQGFRLFLPQGASLVSDKGTWSFVRLPSGGLVEIESPSINSTTLMMIDPRPAVFVPKPAPNSTYSLMEAILSATPGEVQWWRFRSAENLRIDRLLELKFLLQFELSPRHPSIQPIYPVASTTVRGYQFGNPDVAPYEVEVELFNSADRSLALKFQGPRGHGRLITQEAVNAMIASIETDRPTR